MQVAAWSTLQASHLLEGVLTLRRVFNPRWLTLESGFQNRLRHACAAAMMHAIMAEDLSEGQLEHLTASQLEGTPPRTWRRQHRRRCQRRRRVAADPGGARRPCNCIDVWVPWPGSVTKLRVRPPSDS